MFDLGSVWFGWVGLICACLPNGGVEGFVWVGFGQTICLYFLYLMCVKKGLFRSGWVGLGWAWTEQVIGVYLMGVKKSLFR